MRDILQDLARWRREGHRFAVATVIQTWGSSPRQIGSAMGIREDGLVCGSVSGGCIESAVISEALESLKDGKPRELKFDQVSPDAIWEVGLSCGGAIRVWINPLPNQTAFVELERAIAEDRSVMLLSCLSTGEQTIIPSPPGRGAGVREDKPFEQEGQFYQPFHPRERLLIFGASHLALPLISFAKALGFEVVLVDPRTALMREDRFTDLPDKLICGWPKEAIEEIRLTGSTYAVMLSHDPKIDDAALSLLLRSPVAYIGALGSPKTQAKRRESLQAQGFSDEEIARIHGPIGLDIGAKTPEEIAVSIVAEIVKVRRG